MKASPTSSANPSSSGLTVIIGPAAPHLTLFTICLLLLLYGYEIFNFSLSIDEEVFTHQNTFTTSVAQGRWGLGVLARYFPPMGNIPMLATLIFCVCLGVSACILARVMFRSHAAQWSFAGIFISSPFWPHIVEFNMISWGVGIGCVLTVVSLLLVLADYRLGHFLAVGLLAFAIGTYQSLFVWFPILLCLRYVSLALGTAPVAATEEYKRFPWLRSALITVGALVVYLSMAKLFLAFFKFRLSYVQDFIRLSLYKTAPLQALSWTFQRSVNLLGGNDPIYLGYGRLLTLLPLWGFLILIGRLLWRGPLSKSERLLAGVTFAAAFAFVLSPIVLAAGGIPARVFITCVPFIAFLAGVALSFRSLMDKPLYLVLGAVLFISIWISVSLFYADHVARQRDEILTARIMARVDQVVPNPPAHRIPFVVVAPAPANPVEGIQKVEIFGMSFFEHGNGDPVRIAAYLRILGIDTLEPGTMAAVAAQRSVVEGMPLWPAQGSVAMVNGILVIKLGPLPPA